MVRTHVIAIVLVTLVGLAAAQTPTTAPAPPAASAPATVPAPPTPPVTDGYTGQITGENVYIRSGPSIREYPVMKLSSPARVRVLSSVANDDGEWLKIVPPEGAFSLISKQYVTVEGDVGTLTGDRVRVRAGSVEQPAMVSRVQGYLQTGDTVKIIGDTEEYHKIVPPAGAALYVNARYVVRATATTTAPATRPATQPAAPTPKDLMDRAIEAFKVAEAALMAEYAKPAAQRDLAGLLKTYQAIEIPDSSPLTARVSYRIRYLQLAIQKRKGAVQVQALAAEADRQRQALAASRSSLTSAVQPRARDSFTATGRLAVSRLFRGDGGRPKRWMLLDAEGGMRLMYVQSTTAQRELANAVGWKVQLTGRRTYHAGIQSYLLHVRKIRRLPGGEPVRTPRVPQPGPAPEPDIEPRPWVKPEGDPADAAPAAPATPAVPAPAALPVVPATQAAPPVVDTGEYQ